MQPIQGMNQKRVQALNRSLIVNIIRQSGTVSRAELARKSNLKQATITNITKELIQLGYIRETGYLQGQGGRRSVGLTIDETHYRTIAARLTRQHVTVGLFTILGTELSEERTQISVAQGPEEALNRLANVVNSMVDEAGRDKVLGFGLAVPGPFIRPESRIALVTGFPNWEHVMLREALEERIALPLLLEHDTTPAALAEWWIGVGKSEEYQSMIALIGGQGVGAGIVYNGRILLGSLGTAGEIGHHSIDYNGPQCECGNRGCLELYTSTSAIVKAYRRELELSKRLPVPRDIIYDDIAGEFLHGDKSATRVIDDMSRHLAFGLASLVNTLNPDLIVVGDEWSTLGEPFVELVRQRLKPLLVPDIYVSLSVKLSSFNDDGCIRGMAMMVADEFFPSSRIDNDENSVAS